MSAQTLPQGGAARVLGALAQWAEKGWIRRLDVAMARFLVDLCPAAQAPVVLAAALVTQMEGRGHTCVLLDDLLHHPNRLLGWGGEAAHALNALMVALPADLDAWIASLRSCDAVRVDGATADRGEPLLLSGGRLYLRRYWRYERRVAAQVALRVAQPVAVDETRVRTWLDRLFPEAGQQAGAVDWQKVACAVAATGRLSVITGGPGTGKTHTAARLLALLFATAAEPERLRVALAAPTGKAAARLKQSIDAALGEVQGQMGEASAFGDLSARIGAARTLHALLGARPDTRRFRHGAAHPLDIDVLIVDEASMVHLEMMAELLDALPADARVILLGDKDQLASVEAGAVLGELCANAEEGRYRHETIAAVARMAGQRIPGELAEPRGPAFAQHVVMLRESRRFGGEIGRLALAVNAGDAGTAESLLTTAAGPGVFWMQQAQPQAVVELAAQGRAGASRGYGDYLAAIRQRPSAASIEEQHHWIRDVLRAFDRFRVLCAVREGPWGVRDLNRAIAQQLDDIGLLSARGEWYEGRPVIVTRNDPDLGVFNGDIGIALKASPRDASLRVFFTDGPAIRSVGASRLADVETAFAMTVHKSQGSEFDHTTLVLPGDSSAITRELIYTGITRARSALTLVTAQPAALTEGIARVTHRSSGLLEWLEESGLATGDGGKEAP